MKRGLLVLVLFAVGCGGDDGGTVGATVSAWKSAGLSPTKLKRTKKNALDAKACHTGKVSGIYVELCDYANADAAEKAKKLGLKAVGAHTGVAISRGAWLLVAIDKDKVDPSGRTMNKVAKAFWKP